MEAKFYFYTAAGLLLLILLVTRGASVPMSLGSCAPTDIIRLTNGSSLHLECDSQCSRQTNEAKFEWSRWSEEGEQFPLDTTMSPSLSISQATFKDGGQYACKCLPSGPECLYNVSVLPEMSFITSDEFLHRGESVDLTCITQGFPSNHTSISSIQGVELKQIRKQLDHHTSRSYAVMMEAEEGEYVCTMESYYQGRLVAKLEKSLYIHVYEPPYIIYTTEFVIRGADELGKSGELTCTVQTSPDTGTHVSWWVNGSEISEGSKYTVNSVPMEQEDIKQYKLIISDLQLTDIGSYICQLSSDFTIETTQEAWIQVDYRKRPENAELEEEWTDGNNDNKRSVFFFLACGLGMTVCALGVWKFVKSQENKRQRKDFSPIIGYDRKPHQNRNTGGGHTHHTGGQIGTAMFRRK